MHSRRLRICLALSLVAIFYLLALSTAALLIWIAYATLLGGRIRIAKIGIGSVIAAGTILWSIRPRWEKDVEPGPLLTPDEHPQLFETIREVAYSIQQAMPKCVYLIPQVNAFVTQHGGLLGFGSYRVMGIGLPLLESLTVTQFRAVLAHEFGHLGAGDTMLGIWIHKGQQSLIHTVENLADRGSILHKPFLAYAKLFLRAINSISRAQEFEADALGAQVAGSRAMKDGLIAIHRSTLAFSPYWHSEVLPLVLAGFRPPLAAGLRLFEQSPTFRRSAEPALQQAMEQTEPDPFDSHPPLAARIQKLSDGPEPNVQNDDRAATALLGDLARTETELLQFLYGDNGFSSTAKPVDWDDSVVFAYLPQWRAAVLEQQEILRGLSISSVPDTLRDLEAFMFRLNFPKTQLLTREQRRDCAVYTLSSAVLLALLQQGWTIHAPVGEPIAVRHGEHVVYPFTAINKLADREWTDADWSKLQLPDVSLIPLAQSTSH